MRRFFRLLFLRRAPARMTAPVMLELPPAFKVRADHRAREAALRKENAELKSTLARYQEEEETLREYARRVEGYWRAEQIRANDLQACLDARRRPYRHSF